jgi:hypothetical protein
MQCTALASVALLNARARRSSSDGLILVTIADSP